MAAPRKRSPSPPDALAGRRARRLAVVASAILVALVAASARADMPAPKPAGVALRYAVRWGPLRLFSLESHTLLDREQYRMSVTIRTEGMVHWLVDWSSHTETHGRLTDAGLRPVQRTARAEYGGQSHRVIMAYADGEPPRVEVEPDPRSEGLRPVDPALRGATIDPETATLVMVRRHAAGQPCTGVERVFDGRLRYDLHLAEAGTERLALDGDVRWAGIARLCDATVHAIAGYPEDDPEAWGAGMRLRYWLAPVLPESLPVPARVELSGSNGTLRAHLEEARVVEVVPAAAVPSRDLESGRGAETAP